MKLYKYNRKNLMATLPDGLILLTSAEVKGRNSDVDYRFRQDSNFLYLTGNPHPDYALLLDPKTKAAHLFLPDLDPHYQIWVGKQMTTKAAKTFYGTENAHYVSEFPKIFNSLKKKYKKLYRLGNSIPFLKKHNLKISTAADKALAIALSELRIRKSSEEIENMRTANSISREGHVAAMRGVRPGQFEYQAQALLEKEFLAGGAIHNAYPSIVASGKNAAILHYHDNNMPCRNGDLLLIDAGCEWNGYASDITRTFPVNGRFTTEQKEIYEVVLKAQKECIAMVRPNITMVDIHRHACRTIMQGLMDLGIYHRGNVDEIIKNEAHAVFFPHGIGHLLGLDVHDVGAIDPKAKPDKNKPKYLRASRKLEPNFAITVEPGIYFIEAHFNNPATRKKTAKHINWKKAETYRSVGGIRIEDDILVTKNGYENLTNVPKEVAEIESVMAS